MRKTDKKIDNRIIKALTEACDLALEQYLGFKWLTHNVNYQNFPASLTILCVFDTNQHLAQANQDELRLIIKEKLSSIGIDLKNITKSINFDSEENIHKDNNSKRSVRLH